MEHSGHLEREGKLDLGVRMGEEVLEDKLDDARERGRREATWNTRRLPLRLTPGWSNRLYVASGDFWRGYFPLSGDVLWNPEDEGAPYALVFDALGWTRIHAVAVPRFRGWRYLESPPGAEAAAEGVTSPPRRGGRRK